jgi:malate dehydrogenase (oxaloacetate-decarboxylating)
MAIAAAHSLARMQQARGLDENHIMPTMDDIEVFPREAADVAKQAILDGVARASITPEQVFQQADHDIKENREVVQILMEKEIIKTPPKKLIDDTLAATIAEIRGQLTAVLGNADE